jgi:hypothetical protein
MSTPQYLLAKGVAMRDVLLCKTQSAIFDEAPEASTIDESKCLG